MTANNMCQLVHDNVLGSREVQNVQSRLVLAAQPLEVLSRDPADLVQGMLS